MRKVIAIRLSEKERAELQHAFKREGRGHRVQHGHYGFATWMRRVLVNHARQLELALPADRHTRDRRIPPAPAGEQ